MDAIPIGRPATTRATLDINAAARLVRSKSILSLVKRVGGEGRGGEMEREREGEREKAAIGISAGFITQPGGNEPRNPGRGGIASLVPASPCASLRRKLPGRPFPRVYHVVKGTSCRSSREGERERERASRRRFISRQYRGRRGRSPFVPRRNGAIPARRNVIPIATMITFNRVEHAIIGIGN
jgi:hypothetical protein